MDLCAEIYGQTFELEIPVSTSKYVVLGWNTPEGQRYIEKNQKSIP
jgi:hypothetical protein